jgi:hypothetical protein
MLLPLVLLLQPEPWWSLVGTNGVSNYMPEENAVN